MKKLVVFAALLLMISCSNKDEEQKAIITNYIKEMVQPEDAAPEKIGKFFAFNDEILTNEKLHYGFKNLFYNLNVRLDECDHEYSVLTYKEAIKQEVNRVWQFEEGYKNHENVFFVVCNYDIVMPLVLTEGKIISFQSKRVKNQDDPLEPAFIRQD